MSSLQVGPLALDLVQLDSYPSHNQQSAPQAPLGSDVSLPISLGEILKGFLSTPRKHLLAAVPFAWTQKIC